ncbi:MAG TPA: thioredoxin-disulfide reductase [Nitrospirota bacterium]|nr:thioredoxin-disulfide reductase [Nitrospirota bacterium]
MHTGTYEVIIIGGGPAGLSAGLYCQRAGLTTVLFEKGLLGGQIAISKEVENYPGMEGITGFELAEKLASHARAFGVTVVQNTIRKILPGRKHHTVLLDTGDEIRAHALILAAGGSVRKLGIPGEAEYLGSGVSYCGTCDGFFFKGREVVVVGGGDTAAEEALHLVRLAKRVVLVHRRDTLKAQRLLQSRVLSEPGIEIVWNSAVTEIRGDGKSVTAVSLVNTLSGERSERPADGVFIFIGYVPNAELIPAGMRVDELGFVMTDENRETSVPGIFAAGDIRHTFANQIVIAAADGAVAALAAARHVEILKAGGAPPCTEKNCAIRT